MYGLATPSVLGCVVMCRRRDRPVAGAGGERP
jgi:hypothetical protein